MIADKQQEIEERLMKLERKSSDDSELALLDSSRTRAQVWLFSLFLMLLFGQWFYKMCWQVFEDLLKKHRIIENVEVQDMIPASLKQDPTIMLILEELKDLQEVPQGDEATIQEVTDKFFRRAQYPNESHPEDTPFTLAQWGNIQFMSTYKTQTLSMWKPDGVLIPQGFAPSAMRIIATVEKKPGNSFVFSPQDKQHVLDFHVTILRTQTKRSHVFSILHNGKYAVLVKSVWDPRTNKINHQFSSAQEIRTDAGKQLFANFFSMTEEEHGYTIPKINGFKIESVLGQGSTSTAYCVTDSSNHKYVAKVYCRGNDETSDMLHEKDILSCLSSVENVPVLVSEAQATIGNESKSCLIVKPVAMHLAAPRLSSRRTLSLTDVFKFIDVLRNAHNKGIIHRDIRLANLYLKEDAGVLVNDWGCACKLVNQVSTMSWCAQRNKALVLESAES